MVPPKPFALVFFLAVLCIPMWSSSAWAKNAGQSLKDVERKIQTSQAEGERQKVRADKLKSEINAININLVAAAKRVQDQETQVAILEVELSRLEREATAKTALLHKRRQQFSGVVMALSRIARFPTEALIAQPISPEDTVRSAILLRAAVPAIEARAKTLKGEINGLGDTRIQVQNRRTALQGALKRLQVEEGNINTIRQKKAALRAEAISKSRAAKSQARQLAKKAKSLRDLVSRLNSQKARARLRTAPNKVTSLQDPADLKALSKIGLISKARGHLPFPATGRLVGLYGQALDGGVTRKGISIATRPGGQVVSPFDGTIVFAGPFRGYGQLLIIDHGEGYHSLLAGLGRIDVEISQPVLAGEPIASMSNKGGFDGGAQPVLYVEFRRNNQPINPLPWLVARKGTPKG